jgi:hypothetical protein
MHCPIVSNSHSRGLEKVFRVLLGRRYYRCHACDWRGSKMKKLAISWEKVIIFIVYCTLVALIMRLCIKFTPGTQQENISISSR